MSRLSELAAKPEKVKIGNIEFEIKPLTVKDLLIFEGTNLDNPGPEIMEKLVRKTLKDSFPDSTDEEIDNVGFEHINELSKHIARVNKLDDKEGKDLVAEMKARKDAAAKMKAHNNVAAKKA